MNKEQKRTLKGAVVGIAALLLLAGVFYGGMALQKKFDKNDIVESSNSQGGISTEITASEMKIRALATKENADGSVTKTFSFTIEPANATDQTVTATAKYADGSNCDAVVTVAVDNTKKEISVTAKADFDKVVNVVVTSTNNVNAKATIKCDYVKKVKAATYNNAEISLSLSGNEAINYTNYIDVTYSKYTKDKDYSLKFKSIDLGEASLSLEQEYDESVFTTQIKNDLKTYISGLFSNPGTALSDASVWNISSSNAWHSFLSYIADTRDSTIDYTITSLVVDVVDSAQEVQKTVTIANKTFSLYLGNEWGSSFVINVDSLSTEVGNLGF